MVVMINTINVLAVFAIEIQFVTVTATVSVIGIVYWETSIQLVSSSSGCSNVTGAALIIVMRFALDQQSKL